MTAPFAFDPMQMQMQSAFTAGLAANPVATPGRGRLIDRVRASTGALLGGVRNALTGPTPQGYEGLLDPAAIAAARPTLLQMIAGGEGASYRGNLDRAVSREMLTDQVQGQRDLTAARQGIAQRFAVVPNETRQQAIERMIRMQGEYARVGDVEMVGKLGEMLKSLGQEREPTAMRPLEVPGLDEQGKPVTHLINPQTLQTVRTIPREASGSGGAGGVTATQQRTFERQLMNDFRGETDRYQQFADAYSRTRGVSVRALKGNAYSQMALIFNLMRALDPATGVRETEYARAEELSGKAEQLKNIFRKLYNGQFLTAPGTEGYRAELTDSEMTQVERILGTVDDLARGERDSFDEVREGFAYRAARYDYKDFAKEAPDYFRRFRDRLKQTDPGARRTPGALQPTPGFAGGRIIPPPPGASR